MRAQSILKGEKGNKKQNKRLNNVLIYNVPSPLLLPPLPTKEKQYIPYMQIYQLWKQDTR